MPSLQLLLQFGWEVPPMNNIWTPPKDALTSLHQFINYVNMEYNLSVSSYTELHQWSIQCIEQFWQACVDFSNINFSRQPDCIIKEPKLMPNNSWFLGAKLNYAQHCLQFQTTKTAIYDVDENGMIRSLSCIDLYDHVSKWVQFLLHKGINKGDIIAGIVTNQSNAVVIMLACASIGAIWTSCSPDFGEAGIVERLVQLNPTMVISVAEYRYKGDTVCLRDRLTNIKGALPNTAHWVLVSELVLDGWEPSTRVDAFVPKKIDFVQCEFNDPLVILFSSGTTGKPKCMVHSVGGTLVQHVKEHRLHCDISVSDTVFYYTTCGWMMWNWMASALASHAALVCYDGAPITQDASIWDIIPMLDVTVFGCSASFIGASEKKGMQIQSFLMHHSLRLVLSTGSPLLPHHYDYVYNNCKDRPVQLGSISGGTDIMSCFALCNPIDPVQKGKIQCIGLGMDVVSRDDHGSSVTGKKGELVCIQSVPSMPIYFLNDPNYEQYKRSYFKNGQALEWYHGDYVIIHDDGQVEILGRSDSTLNPGGVRMGSAEFYQVLDGLEPIDDSLVCSILRNGEERIVLFLLLKEGMVLTPQLKKDIRYTLRDQVSPRHMPRMIFQVTQIPYTINGKKCEVGIKKIINRDVIHAESVGISEAVASEYINLLRTID